MCIISTIQVTHIESGGSISAPDSEAYHRILPRREMHQCPQNYVLRNIWGPFKIWSCLSEPGYG